MPVSYAAVQTANSLLVAISTAPANPISPCRARWRASLSVCWARGRVVSGPGELRRHSTWPQAISTATAISISSRRNSGNATDDVRLGNGDGTFQPALTYDPGVATLRWQSPTSMATVSRFRRQQREWPGCALGNGDGTFQQGTIYDQGASINSVAVAGLQRRRCPATWPWRGDQSDNVSVLLNQPEATRLDIQIVPASSGLSETNSNS